MHHFRVLILAFLANPTATNWIHGLKSLGYNVAVLNWRKFPATQSQLYQWGFENKDIPIFNFWKRLPDDVRQSVLSSLGGTPDILFCWEGTKILKPLQGVKQSFPSAKVVHCLNTFPNALNALAELRLNWRHRKANSLINGYIFYSEAQAKLFWQRFPSERKKNNLIMIEPFLKKAFARPGIID